METVLINGIEETKGLVAITQLSYGSLSPQIQFQLFLAATAKDWPISEAVAQEALKCSMVEQVTSLGEDKATVKFHQGIANIIAWIGGEKPWYLQGK